MTAINRLNSLQLVCVDPDTAMTSPTGKSPSVCVIQTIITLSHLHVKITSLAFEWQWTVPVS